MAIGGLSQATMTAVTACRRTSRFANMADFLERVRPEEDEVRALIHCGALDTIDQGYSRTQLLWILACRQAQRRQRRGQADLFGPRTAALAAPAPPVLLPTDTLTRLRREFAVLGFLCDRHPITLFAAAIAGMNVVNADRLPGLIGRRVQLALWLITGKVVHTRHGDPMQFLTFEDETGIVETTFFPEAYRRFCHMIERSRPYLLTGTVKADWGVVTLDVERVAVIIGRQTTDRSKTRTA